MWSTRSSIASCPGDYGHFNLLTADAVGAVNALRSTAEVNPRQIGLVGTSQAGWIVPRAAMTSQQVTFVALASAAVLPYGQVKAYAELTGRPPEQATRSRPCAACLRAIASKATVVVTAQVAAGLIQTIQWAPSRPLWIDDAPNVSRQDPLGADQFDAERQATDLVATPEAGARQL